MYTQLKHIEFLIIFKSFNGKYKYVGYFIPLDSHKHEKYGYTKKIREKIKKKSFKI